MTPAPRSFVPTQTPRISWLAIAGCGVMVYGLVLTNLTIIVMLEKLVDWSTREALPPALLLRREE
jgi:hypothetical protein